MTHAPPPPRAVEPISITPLNVVWVTGLQWRQAKKFARENGIPITPIGRKPAISAEQYRAAFARHAASHPPPRELSDAEELAQLRADLGYRVVTREPGCPNV